MEYSINTPLSKTDVSHLRAGDTVVLSGTIYTARDAAHKILCEMLDNNEELPFDIKNQIIYFAGPCPAAPGRIIGSCGPTTSCRMDKYSPKLLSAGLLGMIGKGDRDDNVVSSIVANGAVYFAAIGGAGALISQCVKERSVVAFPSLGTEAVSRLLVYNFPLVVAVDCLGNKIYKNY